MKTWKLIFGCAIYFVMLATQALPAAPCKELLFEPPVYFPSGMNINGLAKGDLNGDGDLDLIAANEGSGSITVRFGDGSGGYPTSLQFFGTTPSSVAVADLNRDGILDIVASHRTTNTISVRLGLGGGAFGEPSQTATAPSPNGVATGDLNHDGNIDIVATSAGGTAISLLLGNATGTFPTATLVAIPGSGSWGIVTADLNGDGHLDVATANRGSSNISVLFGNGAGGFGASFSYAASFGASSIAADDLNGDGRPDLAVANLSNNSITVRFNNGSGLFPTAMALSTGLEPFSVAVGDLDDDGANDIVATNRRSNFISIYRGTGGGGFAPRMDLPVNSGPRAVTLADLDDNGSLDIAAGTESNNISVLLNSCSMNTAPTISSQMVTREQDAGVSNSTIAMVDDGEDAPDELDVTVNGSSSATVNGVTVSNIDVDNLGNVTADVAAACGASDAEFALSVSDNGGLTANATLHVNVTNETTPPLINKGNPLPNVTAYLPLNSPGLSIPVSFVLPSATDNCSESPSIVASPVSGSIFDLGRTTVMVTASDQIGNTSTASFYVDVLFTFSGFSSPVDPFPSINMRTAGSAVPMKFSLSGDKGPNILAAGYPASSPVPCDHIGPGPLLEPTIAAGGSGLSYDASTDEYTYVWKTNKAWRDSCRVFVLRLADGSEHYARFRFR